MSRFRAAALLHNTAATGTTASSSTECELRYWWSRGRLHEAASRVIDASGCYHHCAELLLHHLQNNTRDDLQIPHCQIDATISTASITAKLELLQLHDVLRDAEHLQQQGKCKEAANMLAPVLLSCDEKEALMAAVDRRTWLRALHVLHAVAASTEGMEVMVLRCHLRLLRAGLPQTPPHITTLFKSELLLLYCIVFCMLKVVSTNKASFFFSFPSLQIPTLKTKNYSPQQKHNKHPLWIHIS